jgi:hypothetical protein
MCVLGAWSLVLRSVNGPWSTLVLGTWRKRKDRPVEAELTKDQRQRTTKDLSTDQEPRPQDQGQTATLK